MAPVRLKEGVYPNFLPASVKPACCTLLSCLAVPFKLSLQASGLWSDWFMLPLQIAGGGSTVKYVLQLNRVCSLSACPSASGADSSLQQSHLDCSSVNLSSYLHDYFPVEKPTQLFHGRTHHSHVESESPCIIMYWLSMADSGTPL